MIGLLNSLLPVSGKDTDWNSLGPTLGEAPGQTLYMVCVAMLIDGVAGLAIGVLPYITHDGDVLHDKLVCQVLNILINFICPIPFIILATAIGPLTKNVVGITIDTETAVFVILIAATFVIARLVEQNLMSIDPDVIEAARVMGTGPWRIIHTVVVPEALGSLALGYTFAFIAAVDMSATASYISGGGLDNFTITYDYQALDRDITLVTTLVIIFIVQLAQISGNWLSKKIMRR